MFAASTAWAMVAFTPLVFPDSPAAAPIRQMLGWFCHQIEARSFQWAGAPLPVCHRCTGIYLGMPLGALAGWSVGWNPLRVRNWLLALAPMGLQVVAAWAWPALDIVWLRFATGASAGAGAGLLLGRYLDRP